MTAKEQQALLQMVQELQQRNAEMQKLNGALSTENLRLQQRVEKLTEQSTENYMVATYNAAQVKEANDTITRQNEVIADLIFKADGFKQQYEYTYKRWYEADVKLKKYRQLYGELPTGNVNTQIPNFGNIGLKNGTD